MKAPNPFKFYHYNAFYTNRKGWDTLLSAFAEEFKGDPKVELHYKTTHDNIPGQVTTTPNVFVHVERLKREEIVEKLKEYHCLVLPHIGEGGPPLPALEALATGMPVIVTGYSGTLTYFTGEHVYFVPITGMQKAEAHPFLKGHLGEFAVVDKEALKKLMREVYEHYDVALEKARKGSEYVHKTFNYDTVAQKAIERFKDAALQIAMQKSRGTEKGMQVDQLQVKQPETQETVWAMPTGGEVPVLVYKWIALERGFKIVDAPPMTEEQINPPQV